MLQFWASIVHKILIFFQNKRLSIELDLRPAVTEIRLALGAKNRRYDPPEFNWRQLFEYLSDQYLLKCYWT